MAEIDIIIPVFNEKVNIIPVLDELAKHVITSFRILICYDHENDNTLPVVKEYTQKADLEIILIKNKGVGVHNAITSGFRESNASAVLVYPADDIINAAIIDRMYLKYKEGSELVAASRFMKGGSMVGCPLLKSILVRTASFTLNWFAFIPIKDASNGFRMFSRKVIEEIIIESKIGFTYSLELLVKCHRLRWKISEVPASWIERKHGKSNFRLIKWLPYYLRWYLYCFSSFYLRRSAKTVKLNKDDAK